MDREMITIKVEGSGLDITAEPIDAITVRNKRAVVELYNNKVILYTADGSGVIGSIKLTDLIDQLSK